MVRKDGEGIKTLKGPPGEREEEGVPVLRAVGPGVLTCIFERNSGLCKWYLAPLPLSWNPLGHCPSLYLQRRPGWVETNCFVYYMPVKDRSSAWGLELQFAMYRGATREVCVPLAGWGILWGEGCGFCSDPAL